MNKEFYEQLKVVLQKFEAEQYIKLGPDSSGKTISPILGTRNPISREGDKLKSNYQHLDNPGIHQAYIYDFFANEQLLLETEGTIEDDKIAAFTALVEKLKVFVNNSTQSHEPSIRDLGLAIGSLLQSTVKPTSPAP